MLSRVQLKIRERRFPSVLKKKQDVFAIRIACRLSETHVDNRTFTNFMRMCCFRPFVLAELLNATMRYIFAFYNVFLYGTKLYLNKWISSTQVSRGRYIRLFRRQCHSFTCQQT